MLVVFFRSIDQTLHEVMDFASLIWLEFRGGGRAKVLLAGPAMFAPTFIIRHCTYIREYSIRDSRVIWYAARTNVEVPASPKWKVSTSAATMRY